MAKIKLYIAVSIDGYIARENGSVDWLNELPNPNQIDHGYAEFYAGIDCVIMGRKTYEEILGLDVGWPYSNCKSYIASNNLGFKIRTENTEVVDEVNSDAIEKMKVQSKKDIWLVGGGNLVTQFMNLGVIDEMIICIIPRVLGKGIRLFPDESKETKFTLSQSKSFETGAVILTYEKANH